MSVNRPLRGWQAALEIRYELASHESREKEWKDEEIGADRVATIVESVRMSMLVQFETNWCFAYLLTQCSQEHTQPDASEDPN
jgi:hypothetical protein